MPRGGLQRALSPEREALRERIAELREEGVPFSEIGQRLGITKNAAIGIAQRMGLGEPRSAPRRAERTWGFPPAGRCVYPLGHPGEDGFRFCGDAALIDRPYCDRHMAIAYRPIAASAAQLDGILPIRPAA